MDGEDSAMGNVDPALYDAPALALSGTIKEEVQDGDTEASADASHPKWML